MPKKKQPGIKEKIFGFIARRIYNITSLLFLFIGVGVFISVLSYNHIDPSFNTAASGDDIHNWLGLPGAHIADILIQSVGLAALFLVPVFISWASHIHQRQEIGHKLLRLSLLFLGIFISSAGLAMIQNNGDWIPHSGFGGSAGTLLHNSISALLPSFIETSPYNIITIALLMIGGCLLTAYAMALPLSAWMRAGQWCLDTLINLCIITKNAVQTVAYWVKLYGEKPVPTETIKRERKPRLKKTEEKTAETPMFEEEQPQQSPVPSPELQIVQTKNTARDNTSSKDTLFTTASGDEDWTLPSIDLLQEPEIISDDSVDERALQNNAAMLQQILEDFKVEGEIVKVHPGPVVTLYELEPAPGIKSSRVIGLSDDIARSMAAVSVRAAVVPGQNVIGIELPNKERQTVYLRDVLESSTYAKAKATLPLALGKDISGKDIIADLAKMPHLLIAGTTGSGKSVAINTMLLSLLYRLSPDQCRLIMIDPKMLELSVYDDIPHLLTPVVTDPGKAIVTLKWLVGEMENRYRAMSKLGVRNIDGYNQRVKDALKKGELLTRKVQTGFDPETGKPVFEDQPIEMSELPFIVVIVDEFADLMLVAGKEVENAIQRLAQMARAAGIHIIMATQRPSVDVITGVIKANFPTRISFSVTSKIDSRTILGDGGAEQLLGMGDMLYMAAGGRIKRVHSPFVSDQEVEAVVKDLKSQGEPDYIDIFSSAEGMEGDMFGEGSGGSEKVDELYDEAVAIIAREGRASTSFIQRHLQIGYNRAARIIEEMERQGVVSKASPTGKREILIGDHSSDTGT